MGLSPESQSNEPVYSSAISIGNVTAHPITGTVRVAVILAQFSDLPAKRSPSQIWQDYFGANNSVAAYYREVSYGKFTLSGDVFGWFTLPYDEAHYGANCAATGTINDAGCTGEDQSWNIAQDAAVLARNNLTFSNYDYYVFVHSGNGQESSGVGDDVWSVTYLAGVWVNPCLDVQENCNQKTLLKFNITPELEAGNAVPLGVYCHEFGHQLGLPDMYNTQNGKSRMGPWELMDKGLWNGEPKGSEPAELSSWSRNQLGWLPASNMATVSTTSSELTNIVPLENTPVNGSVSAVIVPISSEDYYLFENREPFGNDLYLPDHGIVGYHIDQTSNLFTTIGSPASADAFPPGDIIAKSPIEAEVMALFTNSSLSVGFGAISNETIEEPASLTINISPNLIVPITINNETYLTNSTTGSITVTAQTNETFEVNVPQIVGIQPDVRAVFNTWANGDSNNSESVFVGSNVTLTADYKRQYLVSVTSQYGTPTGSGWYDENSQDNITITSIVDGPPGTRYVFAGWTGDLASSSNQLTTHVTGPLTVTALWTTFDWMQLAFSGEDSTHIPVGIIGSLTLRAPNGTILMLANLQTESSFWFEQGDYSIATAYVYGVDAAPTNEHFTTSPNGIADVTLQLYSIKFRVTDSLFGSPLDGGIITITLPNGQAEMAPITNGSVTFENLPSAVYPFGVTRGWSLGAAGQVNLPGQSETSVGLVVIPSVLLICVVVMVAVATTLLVLMRRAASKRVRRQPHRDQPYSDYWNEHER